MIFTFVFLMGLIVGSFLNVCIYRLQKSESIVTPGSHCPNCKHPIPWHDNIPVVSYLFLTGKCRFCKKTISPRYMLVEILTGALFLALYAAFGLSPKFFTYLAFVSALIVITFIDFDTQTIPDHITFPGIVIGPIAAVLFPSIVGASSRMAALFNSVSGAVLGAAMIYAIALLGKMAFKKDAMGDGDIFLLAMIGAFLGWKLVILTFFISPFVGAIVGIIRKMKYGEETMPYGPYLSLGAVVALFFGNKILEYIFYGLK
jgi:leader peptidase (prepilin peptidase) / N-methyltransferase